MLVVNGEEILSDAIWLEELPLPRYVLIVSLCTATRLQLRMGHTKDGAGQGTDPDVPQLTGEMLLSLAENAPRQVNITKDTSLDSTLSSFFLYASYGNLNNTGHARFYVTQSISLAQSQDLTREDGYFTLLEREREERHRLFWLLCVTER